MGRAAVVISKFHSGCDPVSTTSTDLSRFLCAVWAPLECRAVAGQDLDQLSHEFRFVFECFVVGQLEGVFDPSLYSMSACDLRVEIQSSSSTWF